VTEVYNDIVFKVIELTEKYHFSIKQNIYRETLRQLLSIFGNVYYLDGNGSRVKVKCTTGKPDRPTGKDANEDNLVLPYITITETGSQESDERRKINSLLVNEKIWDDKENRAKRVLSLAPRAINITYQINIWAKYNADLDQIRYFIFSLFNPSLDIRTKFSDHTKAFVKNEEDISNAQAADTTDRLVQKTITISVETYLPSPKFLFTNTGEVKSFNAEVILKDTRQDASEEITDIGLGGDVIENDGSSGGGSSGGGITGPLTLSGSLDDVDINSVTFGDVLLWNGDYWVASAIADVIGGETLNHQLLTNRGALDAHPQYASSSVSAYAFGLSSILGSHIASSDIHFTSGSLSGTYVLTSTNSNLSSLVSNIEVSTVGISSIVNAHINDSTIHFTSGSLSGAYVLTTTNSVLSSLLDNHIGSAVHWELSTLNNNYLNASGDSANAGFYLSSVSATNLSATNYYNLPSATVTWLEAYDIVLQVYNKNNYSILKSTPVTIVSGTGGAGYYPNIEPLSSVNYHVPEAVGLSNHVAGLAQETIPANTVGHIIVEGILEGQGAGDALDTTMFSVGDMLYVSSNGQLSNQRPPAPYESHPVGIVLRAQNPNGKILVKIENTSEINDIVGFNLSSTIHDGDLITYDLTTSTFVNKQTVTVSGLGRFGTLSATSYQNLPSSTAIWNANQLQGRNVSSTLPGLYQVLTYDGNGWVPSSVPTGGGGTNDHAALINRDLDSAHPQYASSSVSAQIQSVSAYASGVSSIVSSHINDSTIHFTSGSLSGAYVLTSVNSALSSLVTNIQTSSNNLSGVVGAHIGSAVHWDLETLNTNYLNASGDSASALFYLSSVSATRLIFASSNSNTAVPISGVIISTQTAPLIRFIGSDGSEFFRLTTNVARSTLHMGFQAGVSNSTSTGGTNNTSIGYNAAALNATGANNTIIGYQSAYSNTASNNTTLGAAALQNNTSGADNTAIGTEALFNSPGARNIAVGYRAGYGLSGLGSLAPANNIVIGASSNAVAPITYSNTIVIGSGTSSTASNQTIIGHPQTSSTILRGTVSSTSLISTSISGTNISGAIVSATTVSAGTLHLGGSDGYLINNNGSIIISALNGTVRFPQGFELTGTVSAPTISATTYLNLPTSSLSGLADTQITNPTQGQSLVWNGTKWQPSSVAGGAGPGGVTDHGALTGLEDNDHPQYASSSVSAQIQSVSAYASGVSSIVSSHINDSTIHFTSGSLSGYYAGSAWTDSRYVLTSTNSNLSSLVNDIQTSSNNLSGVVGAHIGSAVHWDLATLNTNYLNSSGDSANASFYLSGLSATNFSATTYLNLPSGTATWNANKLQGINVSAGTPDTSALLVYDGAGWTPGYSIFISSTAPDNNVGGNGDLYFQYGDDLAVSAYILSATNYLNLPTSSLSGLLDTSVTVGNIGTGKSLVWNGSKWIPSSVAGGTGTTNPAGVSTEVQFRGPGGVFSSTSGFYWDPESFGGRFVVSSPVAGLNVYGTTYSTYLQGNNIDIYGQYDGPSRMLNGPGLSVSSNAFLANSVSATTISATTYRNLPTSALSGLSDTLITSPALSSVLKWNGAKWVAAPDATGTGGGLSDAYSTISDGVNSVNATGADTFTFGSVNSILSINLESDGFGGNLNNLQFTVNQDQIGHGNLASLNVGNPHPQYATLSGAVFSGQLLASSLSSTTYLNLPSGTATWNANKIQGFDVTSTQPNTGQALVYNGTNWTPSSLPAGGSTSPGGSDTQIQFNNNGVFSGTSALTYISSTETTVAKNLSAIIYSNTWNVIEKTADQNYSGTTAELDTHLRFNMEANSRYLIRASVLFSGVTTTADIRYGFSGPASPTLVRMARHGQVANATAFAVLIVATAYDTTGAATTTTAAGPGVFYYNGTIQNGANAGTFSLLFAAGAASQNNVVYSGSYLEYLKF
jgi:hypothetical protein